MFRGPDKLSDILYLLIGGTVEGSTLILRKNKISHTIFLTHGPDCQFATCFGLSSSDQHELEPPSLHKSIEKNRKLGRCASSRCYGRSAAVSPSHLCPWLLAMPHVLPTHSSAFSLSWRALRPQTQESQSNLYCRIGRAHSSKFCRHVQASGIPDESQTCLCFCPAQPLDDAAVRLGRVHADGTD